MMYVLLRGSVLSASRLSTLVNTCPSTIRPLPSSQPGSSASKRLLARQALHLTTGYATTSELSKVGVPCGLCMGNGFLLSLHAQLAVLAAECKIGCVCELAGFMHLCIAEHTSCLLVHARLNARRAACMSQWRPSASPHIFCEQPLRSNAMQHWQATHERADEVL